MIVVIWWDDVRWSWRAGFVHPKSIIAHLYSIGDVYGSDRRELIYVGY